jgi:hypothetical protein
MQSVPIEYSRDDFFYLTNAPDMHKGGCDFVKKATDGKCGSNLNTKDETSVRMCYQNELCNNQDLVKKLYDANGKHSQYNTQLLDLQTKYQYKMLTALNLGVGIVGTILYVYYNK